MGWNDGLEEAWAFTDATWSASLGTSLNGDAWQRPGDTLGVAAIISGASAAEQSFLEAGGAGILDGDGSLNYSPEGALETYYDTQIFKNVRLPLISSSLQIHCSTLLAVLYRYSESDFTTSFEPLRSPALSPQPIGSWRQPAHASSPPETTPRRRSSSPDLGNSNSFEP